MIANPLEFIEYQLSKKRDKTIAEEWDEAREEIAIHLDGDMPKELFRKQFATEPDYILEYRKQNYRPITRDPLNRAILAIKQAFKGSNYSIHYPVTPSGDVNPLPELLDDRIAYGHDLWSWYYTYFIPFMIRDANGVTVVWPTIFDDMGHPYPFISGVPGLGTAKVWPMIEMVDSSDIICKKEGEYLLYRTTIHPFPDAEVKETYVLIDEERYYLVGKTDDKYKLIEYYPHNIGTAPFVTNGGKPDMDGHEVYFESFFNAFVPWANEALTQFSDYQAIMKMCGYPHREVQAVACTAKGCNGGMVYGVAGEKPHSCGTCQGTGYILPSSVMGVYVRPEKKDGSDVGNLPMIQFHSPNTDILEYSMKAWKELLVEAEKAVNIRWIDEAQSGVAKAYDMANQYAMTAEIAEWVYGYHMPKLIYYITAVGFPPVRTDVDPTEYWKALQPNIVPPTDFQLKTENTLIEEIKAAREAKMPGVVMMELMNDYVDRRFGNAIDRRKRMELIMRLDYLASLDDAARLQAYNTGAISKEELRMSVIGADVVNDLLKENPDFLNLELVDQEAAFDAKLAERSLTPKLTEGVMGKLGIGTNQAADDAQAKLKGSVGGVTAIIELQASVAKGITSVQAAVETLIELYGFDEETARRIIGEPKKVDISDASITV